MSIHSKPSPLAGRRVRLKSTVKHAEVPDIAGADYAVEDWWDRITGKSWMFADGNPACLVYAMRSVENRLPLDNEVLYGKVGRFGHLIHISEIEEDR